MNVTGLIAKVVHAVSMGYVDEANWIINCCDDYVQLLAINLCKWEDDDERVFGSISLAQQLATECGLEVIEEGKIAGDARNWHETEAQKSLAEKTGLLEAIIASIDDSRLQIKKAMQFFLRKARLIADV